MLKIDRIDKINGEPAYWLSCDEEIKSDVKIHSALVEGDKEELFCKSTNVEGIYKYGAKQLTNGVFHDAGYIWSSRTGCINGQFGTMLTEVVVNGASVAIDINVLKDLTEKFTGKTFIIEQYYPFYDKNKEEPNYRLVEQVVN